MAALADAFVAVKPDLQRFGPDLRAGLRRVDTDRVGRDAGRRFGGGFSHAAANSLRAGAIFAGVAIAAKGLTSTVMAASNMNETLNKSNVIFGRNAGAMTSWARTAATSFGLSREQALAAASGFGDMFRQLGFSGDAAAKMSRSTVRLAADIGSFNNLPTADVQERIAAAFRGEYDSLQKVIPNINAARVEQVALATTGKETAKQLTAQEKAAAVLAIVQRDGARATGDFARTQGGLANQMKIARAQLSDMAVTIGTAVLPYVTKFFGFLTSTAIPAAQRLAEVIGKNVGPVFRQVSAAFRSGSAESSRLSQALSPLVQFIRTQVVPAFLAIVEAVRERLRVIAPIVRELVAVVVERFRAMQPEVRSVWNSVKQIIVGVMFIIREVIQAGTRIIQLVWGRWGKEIKALTGSTFTAIFRTITGLMKAIAGIINSRHGCDPG